MKEILEKIEEAFVIFLAFICLILIAGLVLSPIFVPIIINCSTSNQMFGWIGFGVCVIISISTIVIIARAISKSNERERQRKINDRYHIVKDEGYYL